MIWKQPVKAKHESDVDTTQVNFDDVKAKARVSHVLRSIPCEIATKPPCLNIIGAWVDHSSFCMAVGRGRSCFWRRNVRTPQNLHPLTHNTCATTNFSLLRSVPHAQAHQNPRYSITLFAVILIVVLLRFGPRISESEGFGGDFGGVVTAPETPHR